jgi:pyrimidine deaminase RibD-like protein
MEARDLRFMTEAIKWADDCRPVKESVPKVGAIIANGDNVIGRGRRGTDRAGDDRHAEEEAIDQVADKSKLAGATLYTTLEPCTPDVRRNPLKCCTELIRQSRIKKVFIGILDPNQGVTGKGLWRLQDTRVEVELFPHHLAEEIRIQNAAFIRSQQALGAAITTPKDGDVLRTYETGGKHSIELTCTNPPGNDTYLLTYRDGRYWPQPGQLREIKPGVWGTVAHFGSTGDHDLYIVTADDLGDALIRYYRKVVEMNVGRRQKLRDKLTDLSILGGDYPGIEMNGLPKGLRLEASVSVFVAPKVTVIATSAEPKTVSRGKTLKITYVIECSANVSEKIWLGASFQDRTGRLHHNLTQDKVIALTKGKNEYHRDFTIARDAPIGEQKLGTNVWRGAVADSNKSKIVAVGPPIPISIVG